MPEQNPTILTDDGRILQLPLKDIGGDYGLEMVTSPLTDELKEFLRERRLLLHEMQWKGISLAIGYQDFVFYDQPQSHPGSQALYLGHRLAHDHAALMQYIPPYSETSRHDHNDTEEHFYNLEGMCIITTGEGKSEADDVLSKQSKVIEPNTVHQLRTGSEPSLTLLKMLGNHGLGFEDHHYRQK